MPEFAVKDIKANPFRHIDRYPIRRDKVEALRESMKTTTFWDNIVARLNNGEPEIAFGHHRLVALKEEFGPSYKVKLILRDLSDERMLQMMARENLEEWGTSAMVEHETVRAVVEAFGAGKITLETAPANNKGAWRYAPGFTVGASEVGDDAPYTASTVARFLGWVTPSGESQRKVENALTALQFIEEGILSEGDFEGLSGKQAEVVVEEARRARKAREDAARVAEREAEQARKMQAEAEKARAAAEVREAEARTQRERERARREAEQAKQDAERAKQREQSRTSEAATQRERGQRQATSVGRTVSTALKGGKIGTRQARSTANEVLNAEAQGPRRLPDVDSFTRRLAGDLHKVLNPEHDPKTDRLDELVPHADAISEFERQNMIRELEALQQRITYYLDHFKGKKASRPKATAELPAGR